MEFLHGMSCGAAVTLLSLALLALASRPHGVMGETPKYLPPEEGSVMTAPKILPPRGGSVFYRPTVGPKGGTGVPPKKHCCCCCER